MIVASHNKPIESGDDAKMSQRFRMPLPAPSESRLKIAAWNQPMIED
jgi:hypothetical protein